MTDKKAGRGRNAGDPPLRSAPFRMTGRGAALGFGRDDKAALESQRRACAYGRARGKA